MEKFILSLDQGTTRSRAIVFDQEGNIRSMAQHEFPQIFPKPGWVEHDPHQIWGSQASVIAEAISQIGINGHNIAAIGITNQRETTVVWGADTGDPIYNAIVWQDRRTSEYCDALREAGYSDMIRDKTGLILDAYFSATKVKWILDHVKGAREKAEAGKLRFGTVDSWLISCLTRNTVHVTDATNASRTMLFNIHTLEWDKELLDLFTIPESMLPEVKPSSGVMGYTTTTLFAHEIPIAGVAGDQQAALFGQMCVMQWLRDGLKCISSSSEVEALASSVPDTGGVYFVPALTGLGAPYWDQYARGLISGISRGTTTAHIARAALEGIAFQVYDIVKAMELDSGLNITELKVDGGASRNNLLMQFQSDILDTEVLRPRVTETTALGAAYLAGLAVGYWDNIEQINSQWQIESEFSPDTTPDFVVDKLNGWKDAVYRCLTK